MPQNSYVYLNFNNFTKLTQMDSSLFYSILQKKFPFQTTLKQDIFFQKIAIFATNDSNNELFLLKGFAGTGKTTLISTLVNQLQLIHKKYVLLAPTGRAAKVIATYSDKAAFTIHKKIYFPKKNASGGVSFTLQTNKHKNTLFIVDESSMISDTPQDAKNSQSASLLDDLIAYVYSGQNCKLILIGDTAQLPPVYLAVSPALVEDSLQLHYNKEVQHLELDEVMRQEHDSGILMNATKLRSVLTYLQINSFAFSINGFKDVIRLSDGYEIQDAIHSAYSSHGIEETAFIVRSNKRANQYNQQIRSKILLRESELSTGDLLMVVKNNYFWLKDSDEAIFIANGDIIEITATHKIQPMYGFTFAKVTIRMVDYPNQKPFETILLLDTITSESPSLTSEQSNRLYQEVLLDYEKEGAAYKRMQKVKQNEYFNALQVKFSYAITCHKSQGGQWANVFVEQPYLPEGVDRDYIRWLYTAITRAKEKLYLIGFKDENFE